MVEENISQKFRVRDVDETRNYFHKEMVQKEFISKRHKKVWTTLN